MGRYSFERTPKKKERAVHPIWRGIGCLMLLIVPAVSYALADILVREGIRQNLWFVPRELTGYPQLPAEVWRFRILTTLFGWIARIENLYVNLIVTLILVALIFGVIAMVYAMTYKAAGPPQYGPHDAPPPRVRTKRYKR
jgi:hypothetical protein